MKNLLILCNLLLFIACNDNQKLENYNSYIFDSLKVTPLINQKQYFVVLNPRTSCLSCYLGVINSITKLNGKYNIKVITNYNISRYIKDENIERIIDDDLKFIDANPTEGLNSKFLIFENKKLIFNKTILMTNVDSIESYITTNLRNNHDL